MTVCGCGWCWQEGSRLKPLLQTAANEDKDAHFSAQWTTAKDKAAGRMRDRGVVTCPRLPGTP